MQVGDEVVFKIAKLNRTVEGEVVEIIPPFGFPSNDLMEAIAGTGRHSFKPCDHARFAVRSKENGEIYIPFGKQSVAQSISSFRLESYTLDEVGIVTDKRMREVRIGKRDIEKLQVISEAMSRKLEEFNEVLARLASR